MPTIPRKKNKPVKSDKENHSFNGWQIVYTGFILIMLCFFIMLSSFSSIDQSRVTQFVRSFSNAVNIFSGGLSLVEGETVLDASPDIVHKQSDLAKLLEEIAVMAQKLDLNNVEIAVSDKGLVMTLPDVALFDSGKASLDQEAKSMLHKVARIINNTEHPIRIEGHTDNLPVRQGKFASNWELSTARAVNVLRYFIKNEEISPRRLSAEGFSEYHPVTDNKTKDNRARNRRVEIIFSPQDSN